MDWKISRNASKDRLNVHRLLDFELYLIKSKKINNERIKVQVKRAFKSYSKKDRLCMKFPSTLSTNVQRCLYSIFQNQSLYFLLSHLFWKYLYPQVKINKMVNKNTVEYHPSLSKLISRIHPLIVLWTPKGFISPE